MLLVNVILVNDIYVSRKIMFLDVYMYREEFSKAK